MNASTQNMVKIAMNKSLLKEYYVNGKRAVYLNDGDEFQIQIINPYPFKIGVSIKFNNSSSSVRKLIINPGERVWLERYLDDNKKLRFNSYWVDKDNPIVEKAITDNGKISIEFYKESVNFPATYISTYEPYTYYSVTSPNFTVGDDYHTNTMADIKTNFHQSISEPEALKASTLSIEGNISTTSATASWLSTASNTASIKVGTNSCVNAKKKETGRIEKGGYSHQDFNEVSLNLEPFAFGWETIYIFPASEKPITVKDLQKRYCPECGRKVKEKFKFCPFCGTKL